MKVTNKQLAEVLWELCHEARGGNELQNAVRMFVQYLGRRGLISRAEAIALSLQDLERAREGIERVTVHSAFPISERLMEGLLKELGIEKASIEFEKDTQLLGGAVVRTRGIIWDGSVRAQLTKLRDRIAN